MLLEPTEPGEADLEFASLGDGANRLNMMILSRRKLLLLSLLFPLVYHQALARGGISLDEAVEQARDREGGRVISAETQERDGHQVYNIRLLTKDGKVKRLRIDGQSGKRMNGSRGR